MGKFRNTEPSQGLILSVNLKDQIIEGSFEHTLSVLLEKEKIDLSKLILKYQNDEIGRKAYNPKILLKIILFAYYKGITSSREIESACKTNLTFMALAENEKPDHSTIANFISSMDKEVKYIFEQIVLICFELGLIKSGTLAIDGCKISSNASKEWSGTITELETKREKIKEKIREIMEEHKNSDSEENITKRIDKLNRKMNKITDFLSNNEKKMGKRKHEKQSNITDNDSSKMKTSHGVLQGYNGVAVADSENQIIIEAEAFGDGQEYDLLKPMIEGAGNILNKMNKNISDTKILADNGYFKESNLEYLTEKNIDAYIPDQNARKRDPKFETRDRHREEKNERDYKRYIEKDFTYNTDKDEYICPNGETLRHWGGFTNGHSYGRRYGTKKSSCSACPLKSNCISENQNRRDLNIYDGVNIPETKKMREKIDSPQGRKIYSKRMSIIEPIFGNIRFNKGLNYFSLRTKAKVNIQWLLWCMVHNIEKIVTKGKIALL